jgi:hypothetical protein
MPHCVHSPAPNLAGQEQPLAILSVLLLLLFPCISCQQRSSFRICSLKCADEHYCPSDHNLRNQAFINIELTASTLQGVRYIIWTSAPIMCSTR